MDTKTVNCIQKEFEKLNINIHAFSHINVILIVIAALVACAGLITNNYQSIIASKIIGLALIPFLSLSIIILSGNISRITNSLAKCFFFVALCLGIGVIIGYIAAAWEFITEPTEEMQTRFNFKYQTILLESIMSFIIGIGIYYSIIKTSIVAFIGLILVVSIVPAICNAGLFYGMSLYYSWFGSNNLIPNDSVRDVFLENGNRSLVLFLVDIFWVFIGFLCAYLFNCIPISEIFKTNTKFITKKFI